MAYRLEISKTAQKDLAKLDRSVQQAVAKRLRHLAEEVLILKHLALTGKYAGFYKLRVRGKYRVIYELQHDKQVVVVVRIGKRSDIYED